MALAYERHRISIEEYHRMVDAGVFEPGSRVELIRGELIEQMAPIGTLHTSTTARIMRVLLRSLGDRAHVNCQTPVTLPDDSEPEPDFTVARPDARSYFDHHPYPQDLLLVIEIAESSLDFDREVKAPLYGQSGVGEYWIVDAVNRVVRIYREPSARGYEIQRILRAGDSIAPLAFPNDALGVDDLLPPQ